MEHSSKHQEILFIINASQANKDLVKNEAHIHSKKYHAIEELECACWNGLIYELFPEMLSYPYPQCKNILYQVLTGKNFLYINIGSTPLIDEFDTSIDPYFFMMSISKN